jgi:hypothetical protein
MRKRLNIWSTAAALYRVMEAVEKQPAFSRVLKYENEWDPMKCEIKHLFLL